MALTEKSLTRVHVDAPRTREKIDPSKVRVLLFDMHGEIGFAPHGPIGLESVAGRVKKDIPEIKISMIDTQPELAQKGKVDTDERARQLKAFIDQTSKDGAEPIIGIGAPIFSFDNLQATLFKLADLLKEDPPKKLPQIIIGNALATYTHPTLLKSKLPLDVTLVVGEGEHHFSRMVQQRARGEAITDSLEFITADLQDYAPPLLMLTGEIIDVGGMPKIETSRGCKYAACTFCSRCIRSGKDYHTVKEEAVVTQMKNLLNTFNISRFELTDEEAFDDIEATKRLISVVKAAQYDQEDPLPRTPFAASLRVGALNKLQQHGLLDQLREIGLDKVFLGVEGGSDEYLKLMAKGQKMTEVEEAIHNVTSSKWINSKTNQEERLKMEMGFITFSWRMDMEMLRKNIAFLSQKNVTPYVSSLFNQLEIRAGTIDEKILREAVYGRQINGSLLKRSVDSQALEGYDPDKNFSINSSAYEHVPFLDPEVGEIYKKAEMFSRADESLYYAVKSASRALALPPELQKKLDDFYINMKTLHLEFLQDAVGLASHPDVVKKRKDLVAEMQKTFGSEPQEDALDSVRREIETFFKEELEREQVKGDQKGVMAVCVDEKGRFLLVRPRHQSQWGFPGGNINPGETSEEALTREIKEELGINKFISKESLPTITKNGHHDLTTGPREKLTLEHKRIDIKEDINWDNTDGEIADYLWVDPDDIRKERIITKENVQQIISYLTEQENQTVRETIFVRPAVLS